MTRRFVLIAAAGLAACSGRKTEAVKLPTMLAGAWKLKEQHAVPATQPPAPMEPSMLENVVEGAYEGAGEIRVTVYRMKSSALGLDMAQRWRPAADTVFFYKDERFVVVSWKQTDRTQVRAFVTDLQKSLGTG